MSNKMEISYSAGLTDSVMVPVENAGLKCAPEQLESLFFAPHFLHFFEASALVSPTSVFVENEGLYV